MCLVLSCPFPENWEWRGKEPARENRTTGRDSQRKRVERRKVRYGDWTRDKDREICREGANSMRMAAGGQRAVKGLGLAELALEDW